MAVEVRRDLISSSPGEIPLENIQELIVFLLSGTGKCFYQLLSS